MTAARTAVGKPAGTATGKPAGDAKPTVNDVHLVGRLAAAAASRILPSGDTVTLLRVVVDRPPAPRRSARGPTSDTLDCAIWTARLRQRADRLEPGSLIEIDGALRRRFWRTPGGAASRYEIEVRSLRRVSASADG